MMSMADKENTPEQNMDSATVPKETAETNDAYMEKLRAIQKRFVICFFSFFFNPKSHIFHL